MKPFYTIVLCLYSLTAHAQTHYNSWFRATVVMPVTGKWSADGELQYRRQNGLDNTNPFANSLLYSFRSRLYYQHSKALRFGISPVAFFNSRKVINTTADYDAPSVSECRISGIAELTEPLTNHISFRNREMLEYRIYRDKRQLMRMRFLNGITYFSAQKKWGISIYHELLLNACGAPQPQFFDQNRIGFNGSFNITDKLKIEPGYIFITRLPAGNTCAYNEHDLVVNIIFDLIATDRRKTEK